MLQNELQITRPKKHQLDEICDLLGKVFSHHGYYTFRNYCRDDYIRHSHYDWNASRIGLHDGKIVSHYGVWNYQMRIGSALVKCGGIGAVGTDGDFLKRGVMSQTIEGSLSAMRTLG